MAASQLVAGRGIAGHRGEEDASEGEKGNVEHEGHLKPATMAAGGTFAPVGINNRDAMRAGDINGA